MKTFLKSFNTGQAFNGLLDFFSADSNPTGFRAVIHFPVVFFLIFSDILSLCIVYVNENMFIKGNIDVVI